MPVDGQPFGQAARVVVAAATDPAWDVQLASPFNARPIGRGDVLFGYFDVRGESKRESGGGHFTAWMQAADRGWTELRKFEGAPGPAWSRRYFTTTARRDFPAGSVNLVFHLGLIPQAVEVANVMVWDLGPDADVGDLPQSSLSYDGRAPDAAWRAEAERRIDRHRKADLTVRVLDAAGDPVADARVGVELTRHRFGFGTFIENDSPVLRDTPDGRAYRDTLLSLFNRVTAPTYGAQTWGYPDPATRDRYRRQIAWARGQGLRVKCHPILWSRFDWSPDAWSAARPDPAALRAATFDYLEALMGDLATRGVSEVDLLNEPVGFHEVEDVVRDPTLRAAWFERAHEIAPEIRLAVNEHAILSSGGNDAAKQDAYAAQIGALLDAGAPLGMIGMQAHIGEDFTPPERLWEVLDRFAEFGLPLFVSEFDVNTEDERVQADYTRDFITACFAHPAVESVTLWGFWESQIWIGHAALWRADWTPKPNAVALRELLAETFHTRADLTTDADGVARVRGFLGSYDVTVTSGGEVRAATHELAPDGGTLTVRLGGEAGR